jgi:trimeric autotransporter adhesin
VSRPVVGALIVLGVALATPATAAAAPQSAAAFAQAAAQTAEKAAENAVFDTLVTPEALRALRRLTDSTKAALEAKEARTRPAKSSARPQQAPPAAAGQKAKSSPSGPDAEQEAPGGIVVADIGIAGDDVRSELRVVAAGAATPTLSEPFRTADGTRLFLTFTGASLGAEAPALDSLETVLAGVEAAQRDGDVRIAIDAASLDRYGLETVGDTTILWLTASAAQAAAAATTDTPASAARSPDDLRLAGESARAGWNAFRSDVARLGAAVADFIVGAGKGLGLIATSAGSGIAYGASAAVAWLGSNIPVGGIARTVTFIALLLAPTAGVLLLMRRRPAAKPAAAAPTHGAGPQAARPRAHAAAMNTLAGAPPALEVAQITRRTTRTAAAPAPAAAAPTPALTYGPPRRRPMQAQPIARSGEAATVSAQQTTTSPALTRAQKKAAKAIAKAEAKAARIAANAAARAERDAAKAATKAARAAAKAGVPAQPGKPQVTRTTADARLWAAKTLAANGADAADIARQTGLSREAAGLLVRSARTTQTT